MTGLRMFIAGVVVGAGLTCLVASSGRLLASVSAQPASSAVAAPQEGAGAKAAYKIALENDRVRVRDVTFPAGRDSGMHTHQYAHVGVILTKGTLVFTDPAGKVDTVAFEPGSVGFREANVTHSVTNPGPDPMRVIEVELK